MLNNTLENNIRVSDIDGVIERNGNLFVLETKSPGASVPLGQKIMFENMWKAGYAHILILWGEDNKYTRARYYKRGESPVDIVLQEDSTSFIRTVIQDWYAWCNKEENILA